MPQTKPVQKRTRPKNTRHVNEPPAKQPEPDDFTGALTNAIREIQRMQVEDEIRRGANPPMLQHPKVMNGQPNPDPIIDEGAVRRQADMIMAQRELERQMQMAGEQKRRKK